jgi:hypothetical protein
MDPRVILTRGVNTGLRLGRGTADRVVTIAGPPLGRLTDKVVSRVRRRPERNGPTTFTPSKRSDVADSDVANPEPEPAPPSSTPSPAAVARNIGPPRPAAKPARPARPKSGPGAKLPPPRASTT